MWTPAHAIPFILFLSATLNFEGDRHFAFEICPPLALLHTIHWLLRGNGIRWTEFAVEAVNCVAQRCEIVTPSYTSSGSCDALPTGPARPDFDTRR